MSKNLYTEESIRSLDWKEHIRLRPGMYIGKMGDGSSQDDGIYILLKEVIDNSIDEYVMGNGKSIDVSIKDNKVTVRDFGRGIPLGKLIDCVSKINTGAKYDSKVFKKSVGLNGVGTKAVNALSSFFNIKSIRDGKSKSIEFTRGSLDVDEKVISNSSRKGTKIVFVPDSQIFGNYRFLDEYVEKMVLNYCYLNTGLTINYNNNKFFSNNGLLDLLKDNIDSDTLYPIIHLKGNDIEVAITHIKNKYTEQYFSFVNGQHTIQGGTHQNSFRQAIVKTIREFFGKNYDANDIRQSISAAVSIKVMDPVFESQTKTKLGSTEIEPNGITINSFINDFIKSYLDNFLHKNSETAKSIQSKILQAESERKAMSGIKKLAKERAKKASIHNKKLRDCRVHYNDLNKEERLDSTIFITEGDSASGSITKTRNINTQAVFSLRGKPLNSFGLSKKIVYENEEFNLLQSALNIENGIDELRYNKIVIATDADVDGMHIRLLILTFFLQFFSDLVKNGHVFILQTPLFRVRNKKTTIYCYSEQEKQNAIEKIGKNYEITRFKGLGEISPNEFKNFIGKDMRLDPVIINKETSIDNVLKYYMGKNTSDRQEFIINNLKIEESLN
ncbi:type IIA DNA topoisomerase subunit B [Bacteroidota bacterium]|nr:type IIA DNA topoisomerase subunit B [Bacteroidota bacterium]MDC3115690.1 type IIA DNA topoisomerase subunit B [Bacteroidota bacterium]MDC3230291.1 type IIA DNA topoisomerase subunit B [Bacteroidota bacterium]